MTDNLTLLTKFQEAVHPHLVSDENPFSLFCIGYHLCEKEKDAEIKALNDKIAKLTNP